MQTWNAARRAGQRAVAKELKGARYALWRNPEDLSDRQQAKLADIARTNRRWFAFDFVTQIGRSISLDPPASFG